MGRILWLICCVSFTFVWQPSNAIEELKLTDFESRISDNLQEDAQLDVGGLIKKYGYPFEHHHVITQDGYILGLHRIPHGRDQNNTPGKRPAVLVMHGILSSSADFVLMGPGTALAYILAEAGFDVWLGNARGNYFSRQHLTLNPNDGKGSFWDFSWDEIGNLDLPAMIDYILEQTGRTKLHYIGMSQGTTVFFVMGSLRPEYNKKIITMQALAPVAYLAHNKHFLFLTLAPHRKVIEVILGELGLKEIFPRSPIITWAGATLCGDGADFQPLCSALLFSLVGFNPSQHNATMFPVKLAHAPAGCAARQLVHYGQNIVEKTFQRYDHGFLRNLLEYGTETPPNYNLSQLKAPVYLHYSLQDPFVQLEDMERLYRELGGPVTKVLVPEPTFSHIDFMWGMNAKDVVFDKAIDIMKSYDNNDNK
ncbi:lipase 1 [Pieris rapae]|uniref:lipase 1 n=1 Tax=Pieris rapae TaxID=64459 RepID=UPI001E27B9B8|nr:lipase 1 [Pieris rapae]